METEQVDSHFLTRNIIGYTPKWIIKWGITMIILFFLLLIAILYMVKYPVSISADTSIEYDVNPVPVKSTDSFVVKRSLIRDGIHIQKGAVIMLLFGSNSKTTEVTAPVTGDFLFVSSGLPNSFIRPNDTIGVIIPKPDTYIAKLSLDYKTASKIFLGESLTLRMEDSRFHYLLLSGDVRMITKYTTDDLNRVYVKLSPASNKLLASLDDMRFSDRIRCKASISVDTVRYLHFLFPKLKAL